jgi:hypothetical protein
MNQFQVLSPWADVDPFSPRGITPRVADLSDKTIGLFGNTKGLSRPVLAVVEGKLRERFPDARFSWYEPREVNRYNVLQLENAANRPVFEDWVRGVDTIIAAIGD